MTKLRFHILALHAASLVLAAFAWCAPAAAMPHAHGQEAGTAHAHEAAPHGGHGDAGEAPRHDCGMDETACACAGSPEGVRPATLAARDGAAETGLIAAAAPMHAALSPQAPRAAEPPDRRRRIALTYDEIYGLSGRMLI